MPKKKTEIIDGYTNKYHANGNPIWSKEKIIDNNPEVYWEWYQLNGISKRSGNFKKGEPFGEWITCEDQGKAYKVSRE